MSSNMTHQEASNTNVTQLGVTNETDWISNAVKSGRMLSSNEVAKMFGYKSRASFWAFVAREQPPHIRLSPRNIRFPAAALGAWLNKRINTEGCL